MAIPVGAECAKLIEACARVSQTPEKDEYSRTRQQMTAHIDVCMGGRVAEELIFGAMQVRHFLCRCCLRPFEFSCTLRS